MSCSVDKPSGSRTSIGNHKNLMDTKQPNNKNENSLTKEDPGLLMNNLGNFNPDSFRAIRKSKSELLQYYSQQPQRLKNLINLFTLQGKDLGGFYKLETKNPLAFEVGKNLFNNQTLSGFDNISCATCHVSSKGGTDDLPFALGHGTRSVQIPMRGTKAVVLKKTPKILNLGQVDADGMPFRNIFFKNGRAAVHKHKGRLWIESSESLLNGWLDGPIKTTRQDDRRSVDLAVAVKRQLIEAVNGGQNGALFLASILPLLSPEEMLGTREELLNYDINLARVVDRSFLAWDQIVQEYKEKNPLMAQKLAIAYGAGVDQLNIGHFARAMTDFISHEFQAFSRLDQWLNGDARLSEFEIKSIESYSKFKCSDCHARKDLGAPSNLSASQDYRNHIFHNFRRFNNVGIPPILDANKIRFKKLPVKQDGRNIMVDFVDIDMGRYEFLRNRIISDPNYKSLETSRRNVNKDVPTTDGVYYVSDERLRLSKFESLIPSIRNMRDQEPGLGVLTSIEDQVRLYSKSADKRLMGGVMQTLPAGFRDLYGNNFQFATGWQISPPVSTTIGYSIKENMRNGEVKDGITMTEEDIRNISYFLRHFASPFNN